MNYESLELSSKNINEEKFEYNKFEGLSKPDEINNASTINNIFQLENNLNHELNVIDNNEYRVIKNHLGIPTSIREVSVVFAKHNTTSILRELRIAYVDVTSELAQYGKRMPVYSNEEIEEIVKEYSSVVAQNLDDDVVAQFINMCKEGSVNSIVSYYIKKANARSKRNSTTVGIENICFKFNVDKFRELNNDISQDDMTFDRIGDETYLVIDNYVRVFWELYMLLVFYKICKVSQENKTHFFNVFRAFIRLALITGMKMFMYLELNCCYGELYEELKGFKPLNPNYLFVEDIPDKQQIHFYIKNSDFLTEAYRKEYSYAVSISKEYDEPLKTDKHIDIEFCIMKGVNNTSAMVEVTFSGQNSLGRIYHGETNPHAVVNFENSYNYDFVTPNAMMFLFRTVLKYSKDEGSTSYYTELSTFIKQYKASRKRNLIPKLLSVIFPILHQRPNEENLKEILNKYFKSTDKALKTEYRKLFEELNKVLQPKQMRTIERLRRELSDYVW